MAENFFSSILCDMEKKGLRREMRFIEGAQGPKVVLEGRSVLNFCSNNYLGLAGDKRLADAAAECMKSDGFGSGASRLVCGSMSAHRRLEEKIAEFKGAAACLIFSTGYMANVGIISSVFGRGDIIFSDRLNHASIIDGILLSGAKLVRYPHNDMGALLRLVRQSQSEGKGSGKMGIITDSVFSMDGDLAPLDKIAEIASEHGCLLMIDEAHAFGVMGASGRGLAEHFGVESCVDIQMGTLSKAAGSFGAYCCGDRELIEFLANKARSFIYTTAMPAAVAAASVKAVEIISGDAVLRPRLWELTNYMHEKLKRIGFNIMETRTPIIPILVGEAETAVKFSSMLLEEGVFISAIRPPTVPAGTARLRLSLTASHTKEDCNFVLDNLKKIGERLCLV